MQIRICLSVNYNHLFGALFVPAYKVRWLWLKRFKISGGGGGEGLSLHILPHTDSKN